ncbi:MAG TPA: ParB/RepB/Spo0J family partition protein [Chloroflexota bacterium]|nr:ParB/RepB/Spo0J family partition protein [Chloroflexota bacterium]
MKRRPGGLGRGLDALFPARPTAPPDEPAAPTGETPPAGALALPVAAIRPNPDQPRSRIAEDELADLAASIRVHGVLQPVIVSRTGDDYVLIAGERRWRAAQLAGLETVPAIVKDVAPRERLELAIVENVQRQDLTPLEEAVAYRQLLTEHGLTQEAVAARVGKSRVAVANALRLLHLAPAVHEALAAGRITAGHARALLGCPDAAAQEALLARVLTEDLSVRATEEAVRRGTARPMPPSRLAGVEPAPEPTSPEVAALERELRDALATKVQLYHSRRGGRIVIHYFSDEELQGLCERLTGRP